MIPFNKPFIIGNEIEYIKEAVANGKISGNGIFTQKCQAYFEKQYGFKKALLTNSCTAALEMAAILINIQPGDEVIIPSFTFVSTANAFILRGAKIVFADSNTLNPNIDADKIEELITSSTKAIVPVHYAGIACDMDKIMALAAKYNLFVIEDAAQAIDSYFIDKNGIKKPLGSIGHFAAFSFHETKNIISGEGGLLAINDEQFITRAEIIWEKGTNRTAFFRGETEKYNWVDIGSSFLPSELTAAFLWAQLENLNVIQDKRIEIWNNYYNSLSNLEIKNQLKLPVLPAFATNNANMFYILVASLQQRTYLINALHKKSILAVFHYLPLHSSPFYVAQNDGRELPQADLYSDTLLRLPFFYILTTFEQEIINNEIIKVLSNQ